MTYPLLAGFIISLILATQVRMNNALIESNNRDTVNQIHYSKIEDEQIQKVSIARNNYIKIYNSLPLDIDELISKGLLDSNFKNSEFSNKIVINNGQIKYLSEDVEFSNMYIASNLKNHEAKTEINSAISLRNQTNTINMIKSNDTDEMKSVDFSNIVKNKNNNLGNEKKSDLEIKKTEIKEQENTRNNEMLKVLTF